MYGFQLSDRMLISRVRNFVIWQKSVEFQAEARLLVAAWIWAISWHGGPVQTAGTVRERATHKSRAAWAFFSLGDYIRDSSHLRGSESAHQQDQGEVSSWRFRRVLTVAGCLLFQFASFSTNAGFSLGAGISTPARILSLAWFSANAKISQSAWFSENARISQSAWFSLAARISQSTRISQSAWFSLAASICTYFQYFISLHFLIKYAPIFDWRNYFWRLGLRLILQ